jgi:hypothetical protein
LINNRSSSRRRGRGGSSQQRSSGGGGSGQRDSGNRIDSRARGNAAQLLEKYKNMARDAQMSGDRVQVEYYLQFADHYFRVLADSRARSDDHRPIRPVDDFDGSDEEYGDEGEPIRAGEQGDLRQPQQSYQQGRDGQQPRRDEGRREDGRRDGQRSDGQREDGRRDDRPRDDRPRDDRPRDDRQRRDYQPREERAEAAPNEEQAEPSLNGRDYRERVANDRDETASAPVEAEPKTSSRRSTRSRKPAPVEEPAAFDAALLPSLGISAAPVDAQPTDATSEAVEGEPKPRRRRSSKPSEVQAG